MKNLKNRKYGYRAAAVLSAITMAGAMPITSFARNASKPDDAHVIAEPPAPDINKDLSPEWCSEVELRLSSVSGKTEFNF